MHSNKEITINILSASVRIVDIRKISIRGYISAHLCHSLTAALNQLRVVASSTSNDLVLRSGQHQQTGKCLLPLIVAAKFFVDDPADTSSQRQEECQCGLLLTVAVLAKVCSPVGDRCAYVLQRKNCSHTCTWRQ